MKLKSYILFVCLIVVSLLSCEKQGPSDIIDSTRDALTAQAKTTFNKEIANASAQARIAASLIPFEASKWQLQWNSSNTFLYQGSWMLEVPVLYNGQDITYKIKSKLFAHANNSIANGVTKAVFFKHKDGSLGMYLMRLVLDDTYFKAKQINKQYKSLSLSTVAKDFSGFLIFRTCWGI